MNKPSSPARNIFITGVGVVSPIGIGREAFWDALLTKKSGIARLPGRLGEVEPEAIGGALVEFDAKAFVRPRKALKVMSREIQTAFSAATLAQVDASLNEGQFNPDRIATVFGSEMMSAEAEEIVDALLDCGVKDGTPRTSGFGDAAMRQMFPLWMLKYLPNMATCHIGIDLGALGANNTVISGDTSALAAFAEGVSVITRGIADCLITGAAGTRISPTRIIYHGGLDPARPREPISSSSRPYALGRDGVVGAEGAAVMIAETEESVHSRGARPLARFVAASNRFVSSDFHAQGIETSLRSSIGDALSRAGLEPGAIGAVVSQGMGHPEQDLQEARALAATLGNNTPVVAPIALSGHTGAAVGAFALVTGSLIVANQMVPATLNAERRDPACPINLLVEPASLQAPYVLVIGHTPQGHSVATILGAI